MKNIKNKASCNFTSNVIAKLTAKILLKKSTSSELKLRTFIAWARTLAANKFVILELKLPPRIIIMTKPLIQLFSP